MHIDQIVAEMTEQRDRLTAAIEALTGEKPKPKAKKEPAPRKPRKQSSKEGRVRPQTLETIVGAFNGEPLSREQIMQATGLSPDTVRRGLDAARAADLVRRAGVNDTRAHLFALMPGGGEG